jgi:hypothetical protein
MTSGGQAWWYTPVIPAPGRQKQEDYDFEVSLSYITRPYLKETKDWEYISVVPHSSSKALSLILSTTKKP